LQPFEEYSARLLRWNEEVARRQRNQDQLGNARLLAGLALAGVAAASLGPSWISPWWLIAPAFVLTVLIVVHPRMERALQRARRAKAFYDRAVGRMENRWAGSGSQGEALRDPNHVYADDLDLFGRGSLFELLSTARTATGERTLASWLLAPGQHAEVTARQGAVMEMSSRLDLREDLAVIGEDIRAALDDRRLAVWGARPPVRFFAGARWVALGLALVAAVAVGAWLLGRVTLRPFFYVAVVEIIFAMAIRKQVGEVTDSVNTPARELRLIALLLDRLERETFTSPALVALRARLSATTGVRATEHIRRLERLVEWKEWAHNQIFAVVAAPLLWVPQFAMAIEAWRQECGPHVADWVAAVGEFEALGSLAAFAYERPDAVFPQLLDGPEPHYEAVALGHPLIPAKDAVANDVLLGEQTPLWIVSGSNMSGKSTLLRAVGLSVVMAWAGAPVVARELRLSRLRIGASLRANDSLADHRSRFYAEITKLKDIVEAAGSKQQVLFLLDELLSGTNSHDRRIGAEALIKGLLKRGAIGLATTHDLALAEIAEGMDSRAKNVHFEDQFESGKIAWDYKLRPGIVKRGNALELMRAVGLDV
jgi:hypothetical protein